ncbi:major vault -like, partial [Brachionus plicatilis]
MLNQDEELWEKQLPTEVEKLLLKDALAERGTRDSKNDSPRRVKSQVVTYRVPHNGAVQVYDYKEKKSRVVFGPDLVMLGPDEQFTLISISGDVPKKPNVIKALCLLLGPDFFTDIIQIETSDHARLSLKLSYSWYFKINKDDEKEACKLFNVPDFVGDACKAIASRIRGAVASVGFDDFHKNSAKIIRTSVFGLDEAGSVRKEFTFKQNN